MHALSEFTSRPAGPIKPKQALIFVHGIFSCHRTFQNLATRLRGEGLGNDIWFGYFDYNFHQSIALSGDHLGLQLRAMFGGVDIEVTLVGHSMGGLVCRLALLKYGHELPFVKRLVMLGTPNHGTLHTGRLGLLAQLAREAHGTLWALSTRKTGVKELTEIDRFMDAHLKDETVERTYDVEYITIPAMFYHEGTGLFRMRSRGTSLGLRSLNVAFEFTKALPFWTAGMQIPHDGIVEESSVYMGADVVTRFSERRATCEGVPNCGAYAHIVHREHRDADHVTIQTTERTASILANILKLPPLSAWRTTVERKFGWSIKPSN